MWAARYLQVSRPRHYLTSGGLGTMGFGLPAAIGAQVACPGSTVVCITGDGSLQMCIQEMATATAIGAPVKVLLMDNAALGLVRQWQELFHDARYSATLLASEPDFPALARAYGWAAANADDPGLVPSYLNWLLEQSGPALLRVPVPTAALALPMHAGGRDFEVNDG
jgi:acetolactate synthase-1/2/3 large subunit